MTDRLTNLLHDGVDTLHIPPAPAAAVLTQGRRLRRRRQALTSLASLAVVAVLGGGAALGAQLLGNPDRSVDPAGGTGDFASTGAFAIGSELHIGGRAVDLGEPIKAVYYTAAGAVVRSGTHAATDSPGPSHYTLVTPDGTRSRLDLEMGDRIAGFEPDSNRVAYAEPNGDRWDVVVVDVTTGEEVGRTTVAGSFTWGGWEAPPVTLDGDVVWAHFDDGWTEVNWSTGAFRKVPGTSTVSEAANGRYADRADGRWTIRSMADGSEVGTLELDEGWYGLLSPDGRYRLAFYADVAETPRFSRVVYDVVTGEHRGIRDTGDDTGWTPDGHLLTVDGDTVSICAPISGACTTQTIDAGAGGLKIGGNSYES